MNVIPKILHMIWIGEKEIPDYFFKNLSAWKTLMPGWEFKLWLNSDLRDDKIDLNYLNLINNAKIGAQKADLLRYYVVNKFGGYYVDSDITPIRSLDYLELNGQEFIICHDLEITWPYIINSFFASIPNSKILKFIIEKMKNIDLSIKEIHLTTGPSALGSAYFEFKDTFNFLVLPYWFFYRNKKGDMDVDGRILFEDKSGSFGSHMYAGTWP